MVGWLGSRGEERRRGGKGRGGKRKGIAWRFLSDSSMSEGRISMHPQMNRIERGTEA